MRQSVFIGLLSLCCHVAGFSQAKPAPDAKKPIDANYSRALALADSKTDSAVYYFERYRNTVSPGDTMVRKRTILFYNYHGTVQLEHYFSDSVGYRNSFRKALVYLEKVIDTDSMNRKANTNLMALYYNIGVRNVINGDYCKQRHLVQMTDWNSPDGRVPSLKELLECIKPEEYEKYGITAPFKSALPFAMRIYRQHPEDKRALEALQGIYTAFGDEKQSEIYKAKLETLKTKK